MTAGSRRAGAIARGTIIAAIRLAAVIEAEHRPATADEQAHLIRFTGFGASELANGVFRRPGEDAFRKGWEDIGGELEARCRRRSYASLARCTQYAHFTPEYIVRAVWTAVERLGFRGGRVLEPGIGSGLFPALMPAALRDVSPRHRRRTRSGHRPDSETLAAACEDPQ